MTNKIRYVAMQESFKLSSIRAHFLEQLGPVNVGAALLFNHHFSDTSIISATL